MCLATFRCPLSAAFQTRKEKCDDSVDATRLFDFVRNIIYRLGSRGLWRYATTCGNARADEYGFANEYANTNGDPDANEHARANEYCYRDSNSNTNYYSNCNNN